jgi:hypothetical protein
MWMVMRICKWENFNLEQPGPLYIPYKVQFQGPPGQVGYIPVFETKEAALDYVSGDESQICEIGEVKR